MNQCSCRDCTTRMDIEAGGWTLCRGCLQSGCTPWPKADEPRPVGFRKMDSEYRCTKAGENNG